MNCNASYLDKFKISILAIIEKIESNLTTN